MLKHLVNKFVTIQPLSLGRQLSSSLLVNQKNEPVTRQLDSIEKSFNQVILIGRVGNNPEQRGNEQNPVVTFSLATNNFYNKNEERIQQTEWHRITVFRPNLRDRILNFMSKGQRVMVNGRISYYEKQDPATSTIIKNASIIADDIIFFSKSN